MLCHSVSLTRVDLLSDLGIRNWRDNVREYLLWIRWCSQLQDVVFEQPTRKQPIQAQACSERSLVAPSSVVRPSGDAGSGAAVANGETQSSVGHQRRLRMVWLCVVERLDYYY
jgi:hypothetical protein